MQIFVPLEGESTKKYVYICCIPRCLKTYARASPIREWNVMVFNLHSSMDNTRRDACILSHRQEFYLVKCQVPSGYPYWWIWGVRLSDIKKLSPTFKAEMITIFNLIEKILNSGSCIDFKLFELGSILRIEP